MAYTKTEWTNGGTPAINATNLNKIEQGIYDAHKRCYIKVRGDNQSETPVPNEVETQVLFDRVAYKNEAYDKLTLTNGMVTCLQDGIYRIIASISWDANLNGYRELNVIKNDGLTNETLCCQTVKPLHDPITVSCTTKLFEGDVITLYVYQNSGGPLNYYEIWEYSPALSIESIDLL